MLYTMLITLFSRFFLHSRCYAMLLLLRHAMICHYLFCQRIAAALRHERHALYDAASHIATCYECYALIAHDYVILMRSRQRYAP